MAKRGVHEGSIFQRKDGRWAASLHLGYRDGRRQRKTFYGKTRREVQEALTRALKDLQDGLQVRTDERETAAQYLHRWLDSSARHRVRPRTFRGYQLIVDKHLIPVIGRTAVARLSADEVQRLLNRKVADGASAQTVRNIHACLRRALAQAVRWGVTQRNVATLVDLPRVDRLEVVALSPSDARAILDAVRNDRIEAVVGVTLATGLRQGEALALRWHDVDLDGGVIHVRHALQRMNRSVQLVEPKTKRSRRRIALPASTVALLREHRKRQLQDRLWAGTRWREEGFVFTSSIGTPMMGPDLTRRFQALLAVAGLPRMRFHDLRHGAASLLLAQGVHPRVVMEMLGHSTIAQTMNVYSHVIPNLQREAADKMDAVFSV